MDGQVDETDNNVSAFFLKKKLDLTVLQQKYYKPFRFCFFVCFDA